MHNSESNKKLSDLRDEELCELVRSGCDVKMAFQELYSRHFTRVSNSILKRFGEVGNRKDEAEFIANGVMVKLYTAIVKGDYDTKKPLLPYLNMATRNALFSWFRETKRHSQYEIFADVIDHAAPSPLNQLVKSEESELVEQAMQDLPENYYEVLRLRYVQGLGYAEIQDSLDLSPGSVRGLIFRATKRIREICSRKG